MMAAPAVEEAEAAVPVAVEVSEPVEDLLVVEESDALEVMVLEPVVVELPVAVAVGALVDVAVPEPAVAL